MRVERETWELELQTKRIREGRCPVCGGQVRLASGTIRCVRGRRCRFSCAFDDWHRDGGWCVLRGR